MTWLKNIRGFSVCFSALLLSRFLASQLTKSSSSETMKIAVLHIFLCCVSYLVYLMKIELEVHFYCCSSRASTISILLACTLHAALSSSWKSGNQLKCKLSSTQRSQDFLLSWMEHHLAPPDCASCATWRNEKKLQLAFFFCCSPWRWLGVVSANWLKFSLSVDENIAMLHIAPNIFILFFRLFVGLAQSGFLTAIKLLCQSMRYHLRVRTSGVFAYCVSTLTHADFHFHCQE